MMPPPLYSRTSGCHNIEHLKLVMTSLASFHARWWNAKREPPLEWVPVPGEDNCGLMKNGLIYAAKKGKRPSRAESPTLLPRHATRNMS